MLHVGLLVLFNNAVAVVCIARATLNLLLSRRVTARGTDSVLPGHRWYVDHLLAFSTTEFSGRIRPMLNAGTCIDGLCTDI